MNPLTRIFLALYSLALIGAAVGFGLLAWYERNRRQLDIDVKDFNLTAAIMSDNAERWLFTAILVAVGLVGLFTLWLALAPRRAARGGMLRMRQEDGGSVEVSSGAIEALLREELEQLPDVRSADPRVRVSGGAVESVLILFAEPSANISNLTNEASRRTIETLKEQVGVSNVRRPVVRINYDQMVTKRARDDRGHKPQAAPRTMPPAAQPVEREPAQAVARDEPPEATEPFGPGEPGTEKPSEAPPAYPPRADEREQEPAREND